jgi:hypothetical protein
MSKLQSLYYNKSFTDNLSQYERTLQNNMKYQFDEPFAAPVNAVTTPN